MIVCLRDGCENPLPKLAIAHADPYCSARCCRIDHGLETDGRQPSYDHARNRCNGCGRLTSEDEFTPGCHTCSNRKWARKQKGRLVA